MPESPQSRQETILVVDDNELVLKVVAGILTRARYKVLCASGGAAAIQLANDREEAIDMLLSDVDMPGLSGPDLGQILKKLRPSMHVMLMSGGDNGNLLVLNYGWAFIQKPFVARKLVEMIINVMKSPNRSQAGGQEFDIRKDTEGNPKR